MKFKKGDNVIVIAGKSKGQKGTIEKIVADSNRVVVTGVNKGKVHIKPKANQKGSIVEREMPLHLSNIMIIDASTKKPTRIGVKMVADKKVRIAKKSGNEIK